MNPLIEVGALRQYRHNNSDDFVFAYDLEKTEALVTELTAESNRLRKNILALETLITECTDCGELDSRLLNSYMNHVIESK